MQTVLVVVPTERRFRPLIELFDSVASRLQPKVHVIAAGFEKSNVAFASEGGLAVAEVFEFERERAQERADAALSIFATTMRSEGLTCTSRSLTAVPYEANIIVAATARLYDLSIVLQPDLDAQTFDNRIPVNVLMQCGGPVLFAPYVDLPPSQLQRIGIAWDGSRAAARAVRDAAPFLARAGKVSIIAINDETGPEASADALKRQLAKRSIDAVVIRTTAERSEIGPVLLSVAADDSLDLMVMGAYGHSPLRERLFGGVSLAMIRAMTLPTLMSH